MRMRCADWTRRPVVARETGDEELFALLRVCKRALLNDGERIASLGPGAGLWIGYMHKPVLCIQCVSGCGCRGRGAAFTLSFHFLQLRRPLQFSVPTPMNCAAGDTCARVPLPSAAPSMGDGLSHARSTHSPISVHLPSRPSTAFTR